MITILIQSYFYPILLSIKLPDIFRKINLRFLEKLYCSLLFLYSQIVRCHQHHHSVGAQF